MNEKILLSIIKNLGKWKDKPYSWNGRLLLMWHFPQVDRETQHNINKNFFWVEIYKLILRSLWKCKFTHERKKKKVERPTLPGFKTNGKPTVIKTVWRLVLKISK